MSVETLSVRQFRFAHRGGMYSGVHVSAGVPKQIDMGPFVRTTWPVDIEVTVSPSGRSVQVYVNGKRWEVAS